MNRKKFYDAVRASLFDKRLDAEQVEGMELILNECERRKLPLAYAAYILATPYHETAATMQPVIETRRRDEDHNPSVDTAIARLEYSWKKGSMPWVKSAYWRKDADELSWLGRGYPQVTHKDNYEWAEKDTGIPFTKNPDLMLVAKNAIPVMFIGMLAGKFTGKSLSDYLGKGRKDYYNSRRVINGVERAADVASYATKFEMALVAANYGV